MHLLSFMFTKLPDFGSLIRKSSFLVKIKEIFYIFFICLNFLIVV